jgi:hypothetical protein
MSKRASPWASVRECPRGDLSTGNARMCRRPSNFGGRNCYGVQIDGTTFSGVVVFNVEVLS